MFGLSKKKIVILLLVIVAVGFAVYKHMFAKEQVSYITEKVSRKTINKVVNATGEVKAVELVTVGAQASGKIEKLYVSIGQEVKKGDMIAQIDSTTQTNAVEENKAKLNSLNAQLNAAKVSMRIAQKQYDRMQKLRTNDAASEEDFENSQDSYEAAKAKVTELESSIAESEISLNTAQTNLGYTKITAPLDGTVVSIPVKEGQTVNAAMNTPTIVQIADLSKMEILIEISEGDIANVKQGAKVTYSILSNSKDIKETTLKAIDPGLTLLTNGEYGEVVGSSEAIYYYGRLVVPNERGDLRIGMTTQTVIYVDEAKDVLSIPVLALRTDKSEPYVNILTPSGVQERPIQTGVSDGLNIEVKYGLQEGDEVIIAQLSASEVLDKVAQIKGPRGF